MAPKTVTKPEKLASIISYFHKSGVAHSLKDLEKALPSVASINGMQVKDYLQALTDENKINVDKIGTVNWYWSFPREEARLKREELRKAKEENDKCDAIIADLEAKIQVEEERLVDECAAEEREMLMGKAAALEKEAQRLREELTQYRDCDPAEIERDEQELARLREKAEKWTEDIMEMEKYLRHTCGLDRSTLLALKKELYESEFDEDEDGLRELPGPDE